MRLQRGSGWNSFTAFLAPASLPWYLVALALVALRCLPSLRFEQFDFDSDQAIVGLMAKHLVDRRAFPLFFYGQHYMLGVQAWAAAPFVAVGGLTVTMLRLPLLLINMTVVVWLMGRLIARGVGAPFAFAATLPLIAPGPFASTLLMETLGASVEPFLYVLLLWHLRHRPVAFGALFCLAYLHREFVLFVLPALAVVWLTRPQLNRGTVGYAARAGAAAAAVWTVVAVAARHVNTLGPPGGQVSPGSLVAQSQMVVMRLAWDPRAYVGRLGALVGGTLPDLFALRPVQASLLGMRSSTVVGSNLGALAFTSALALALVALVWRRRAAPLRTDYFYLYLGCIGVQALLAYGLNGGISPDMPGVTRYVLFALLIPIAILGACVERPRRVLAAAACGAVAVWAALNVGDSARLLIEYARTPPPNEHRMLADYLTTHRIRYGRADYWDAYLVDFLSGERVILAPTAVMRISSYDARVNRAGGGAVTVVRAPCTAGAHVASWCIEDPLHR